MSIADLTTYADTLVTVITEAAISEGGSDNLLGSLPKSPLTTDTLLTILARLTVDEWATLNEASADCSRSSLETLVLALEFMHEHCLRDPCIPPGLRINEEV